MLTGHKTDSVFRSYDIGSPNDLRVAVERLDAAVPAILAQQARSITSHTTRERLHTLRALPFA
jgi:hypothetical protein